MESLFKQATLLGRIEHEITRYCYGLNKPSVNGTTLIKNFKHSKLEE